MKASTLRAQGTEPWHFSCRAHRQPMHARHMCRHDAMKAALDHARTHRVSELGYRDLHRAVMCPMLVGRRL